MQKFVSFFLMFCSLFSNGTWCIKQNISILTKNFGKQVFCVSFRGYLRPCDFANPAFYPAVYFNWGLPLRANGQTRLPARTYWCSRRENDWRLKKRTEKRAESAIFETHAWQGWSINLYTIYFFLCLLGIRWAIWLTKRWFVV